METYGYIYITTNLINKKRYIGQHKGHWNKNYYGSGILIKKAIQKYGIENFDHYPLTIAFNKDELNQLETDFIEYYRPEYNLAKGGYGGSFPRTDEHKRKLSEATKGEKNGMFGKYHSEETKKKISEARKNISDETKRKIGEKSKGRIHSEEAKKKMSEARKGENHPMFGKHHTEETKNKMKNSWNYEKHFSVETKEKMSEARKGKKRNPLSEEHKRKLREGFKQYLLTKKQNN